MNERGRLRDRIETLIEVPDAKRKKLLYTQDRLAYHATDVVTNCILSGLLSLYYEIKSSVGIKMGRSMMDERNISIYDSNEAALCGSVAGVGIISHYHRSRQSIADEKKILLIYIQRHQRNYNSVKVCTD